MNEHSHIKVEDVSEPTKPPKARVEPESVAETFERKKDYLAGFLAQQPKPVEPAAVEPGGDLYEAVIDALKDIYDPEIPVNIYDLGLIYDIDVDPEDRVHVRMTLTAPGCPVAGTLPPQIEQQIEAIPQVRSATVELVWEPQWTKDMMSDAAQLQLGLM